MEIKGTTRLKYSLTQRLLVTFKNKLPVKFWSLPIWKESLDQTLFFIWSSILTQCTGCFALCLYHYWLHLFFKALLLNTLGENPQLKNDKVYVVFSVQIFQHVRGASLSSLCILHDNFDVFSFWKFPVSGKYFNNYHHFIWCRLCNFMSKLAFF